MRRTIAPELICDDNSGHVLQLLQELAKEFLGCFFISAALPENIQYLAILVYCPPQIMNTSIDLEKHFIQVPTVAGSRLATMQTVRISLPNFKHQDRIVS